MKLNQSYTISTPTSPQNSSTWQQLVFGAGSTAGSTAAVVSEESMKCLRYCVSWLQYAIQHIGHQMSLLRNFLVSLATSSNQQQHQHQHQRPMELASIKNDMVSTLRKVVDIITCYASNALPHQAKATIRNTILNLPSRWASLNDETDTAGNDVIQKQTNRVSFKQEDIALRLLAFGQESSDMLCSIYGVVDDTVQRAESWLKRLRLINPMPSSSSSYQSSPLSVKQTTAERNDADDGFYSVLLPPIINLNISSSPTARPQAKTHQPTFS
ncbi:transcription factor Opi1-domain-containing protein [Parasitella parasitica]|nr:transcription factor Opi1-domain-containing protein [Parasitella parasitica]